MLTVELAQNTNVCVMHIESTSTTFEFLEKKTFDIFYVKTELEDHQIINYKIYHFPN